jgi:hypothetical protein
MKRTMFVLATGAMLAASPEAIAQSTTTSPAPTPPAATTPSGPQTSPSGGQMWYSHQPDEMRASKLIGTKVVNAANETIGDVNEIILGKDGKVAAVVVGVGGFLGMGEHEVAMSFNSLQMRRDQNNNMMLVANATKEVLKEAPAWRWETTRKQ